MRFLPNRELVSLFRNKVFESNPDNFLDVGCGMGETASYFKKHLPQCKVFAYEADPVNHKNYNEAMTRAGVDHLNLAISNTTGVQPFYRWGEEEKLNNSLHLQNNFPDTDSYLQPLVEVDCLDNLHSENESYCLWLDVEGHAYEVLLGAKNILKNTKYIMVEVEAHPYWVDQKLDREVIDLLAEQGFKVIATDQGPGMVSDFQLPDPILSALEKYISAAFGHMREGPGSQYNILAQRDETE